MKQKISISTIITPQLERDWLELWKALKGRSIFNSPGWHKSALESFEIKEQKIITAYENKKLIAIMPLVKQRIYGINFYVTPASNYAQRASFIIDLKDKLLVKKLIKEMEKIGNIQLSHLSNEEHILINKIARHFFIQNRSVSPQLSLSVDNNGELILSKKNQIIKKARNEEKFLRLENQKYNLDKGLRLVFKIDEKSTKRRNNYNVFQNKTLRLFYEKLIKHCPENIQMNILYNKNTPVAYEIGFTDSKTYIDSERAYLEKHTHYTPGKVIMVKLAECLARNRYKTLDLGPGQDNFKKSIANNNIDLNNCLIVQNPFLVNYILLLTKTRGKIYDIIFSHPKIYSLYKRLKITLN